MRARRRGRERAPARPAAQNARPPRVLRPVAGVVELRSPWARRSPSECRRVRVRMCPCAGLDRTPRGGPPDPGGDAAPPALLSNLILCFLQTAALLTSANCSGAPGGSGGPRLLQVLRFSAPAQPPAWRPRCPHKCMSSLCHSTRQFDPAAVGANQSWTDRSAGSEQSVQRSRHAPFRRVPALSVTGGTLVGRQ